MKTLTSEPVVTATSLYRVSLAQTPDDLVECQRLRYLVFSLELREGYSTSERSGLDIDPFDTFCDHLVVRDLESGRLVGTYRMQTGETAARNLRCTSRCARRSSIWAAPASMRFTAT